MHWVSIWDMGLIDGYLRTGRMSLTARDIVAGDARCVDESYSPARVRTGLEALADPADPGDNFVSTRLWQEFARVRTPAPV